MIIQCDGETSCNFLCSNGGYLAHIHTTSTIYWGDQVFIQLNHPTRTWKNLCFRLPCSPLLKCTPKTQSSTIMGSWGMLRWRTRMKGINGLMVQRRRIWMRLVLFIIWWHFLNLIIYSFQLDDGLTDSLSVEPQPQTAYKIAKMFGMLRFNIFLIQNCYITSCRAENCSDNFCNFFSGLLASGFGILCWSSLIISILIGWTNSCILLRLLNDFELAIIGWQIGMIVLFEIKSCLAEYSFSCDRSPYKSCCCEALTP